MTEVDRHLNLTDNEDDHDNTLKTTGNNLKTTGSNAEEVGDLHLGSGVDYQAAGSADDVSRFDHQVADNSKSERKVFLVKNIYVVSARAYNFK